MKVQVDDVPVSEFGRQVVRGETRYYYQVVGAEDIVLATHGRSLAEWISGYGVALIDRSTVDGRIICEAFPTAPARWGERRPGELTQISIKEDRRQTRGRRVLLSNLIWRE